MQEPTEESSQLSRGAAWGLRQLFLIFGTMTALIAAPTLKHGIQRGLPLWILAAFFIGLAVLVEVPAD